MKKMSKARLIVSLIVVALLYVGAWYAETQMGANNMLITVLKKGAVYALIAVSMNLLNGFTGLFSLGQAGFMLVGAYVYAVFTIPLKRHAAVYQYYNGGIIQFELPLIVALILAGVVAAILAALVGLPVLRLKSDYLAIATLGFAEIIRAVVQWDSLGPITNGSNLLKTYPTFSNTKILGTTVLFPFIVSGVCIGLILLIINSTYGRAFKAIRDDEVAAEAMGINLFHHKELAFVISCFDILLMVVIGGMGSVTGSVIASFLYIACSEWWLRFLDNEMVIGTFQVPFLRSGFRMVVFSVVIMIVVLFFRRGIMGDKELWDIGAAAKSRMDKKGERRAAK